MGDGRWEMGESKLITKLFGFVTAASRRSTVKKGGTVQRDGPNFGSGVVGGKARCDAMRCWAREGLCWRMYCTAGHSEKEAIFSFGSVSGLSAFLRRDARLVRSHAFQIRTLASVSFTVALKV